LGWQAEIEIKIGLLDAYEDFKRKYNK